MIPLHAIKFNHREHEPAIELVYVGIDKIITIGRESDNSTRVTLADEQVLFVQETIEQILPMLDLPPLRVP